MLKYFTPDAFHRNPCHHQSPLLSKTNNHSMLRLLHPELKHHLQIRNRQEQHDFLSYCHISHSFQKNIMLSAVRGKVVFGWPHFHHLSCQRQEEWQSTDLLISSSDSSLLTFRRKDSKQKGEASKLNPFNKTP